MFGVNGWATSCLRTQSSPPALLLAAICDTRVAGGTSSTRTLLVKLVGVTVVAEVTRASLLPLRLVRVDIYTGMCCLVVPATSEPLLTENTS
jgi:hypothetical protein